MIPLISRHAADTSREHERYAAWWNALTRLREDWDRGKHPKPGAIAEYLGAVPEPYRSDALLDLVSEHLRLTWLSGPGLRLEDYLLDPATVPCDLVEAEFLARHAIPHGDTPTLAEYVRRFPFRADVRLALESRCLAGGRYVRLCRIGRGAMGEVWEAYDRPLLRRVAVKMPRERLQGNPDAVRRFLDEATLTASLEHPGVGCVYEVHEGHPPFYVMRLVKGRSLAESIRERSMDDRRLVGSLLDVCDAMAYAHARGVLHRDLKPGNILLRDFGETVILDWGLAARMPVPTSETAGTPEYMAPEQLDGKADVLTEVFALGATLYEILTGRPPYPDASDSPPAEWQSRIRGADFPRPRQLKRGVSPDLEAVCLKALARNPASRYPAVRELARDIEQCLSGARPEARPAGWLARRFKFLRFD